MSELQNNPEPGTYLIERALGDDLDPTEKHGWRVTKHDGDNGNELGVYDTYTDAVAAVNKERGVDSEDLKDEVTHPVSLSDQDGHGYGAYQANPSDPNYDRLKQEDGNNDRQSKTTAKKSTRKK